MQPTNSALQVFYGTLPLGCAMLLAAWTNNSRMNDFSKRIDDLGKRIDDLRDSLGKRIDELANRVSELERGSRLIQR